MSWNLNTETVTADQPADGASPTASDADRKQGRMDLQKEVVYLTGDVWRGAATVHQRQSADLVSSQWLKPMAMLFIVRLNRQRVLQVKKIKTKPLSSGGRVVTDYSC